MFYSKSEQSSIEGQVCKNAAILNLQDELTAMLITLAKVAEFTEETEEATGIIIEGLFAATANADFDEDELKRKIAAAREVKNKLLEGRCACKGKCICITECSMDGILGEQFGADIRSLKSQILSGLKGMAADARHAAALGRQDESINGFFYNILRLLAEDCDAEELRAVAMKLEEVRRQCTEMPNSDEMG